MGKQRDKQKISRDRSLPPNLIDWEHKARELVELGLCSPLILEYRYNNQNRKSK